MAEQYYDVKSKKIHTVRDRIGGQVVFDHGSISETVFDEQLSRGEIIPYRQDAKPNKNKPHENPLTNAILVSGAAAVIFSKLFERDRTPRVRELHDHANFINKVASVTSAEHFFNRFSGRHFTPHEAPVVLTAMRDFLTSSENHFTYRGSRWLTDVHKLYGHLNTRFPEYRDKLNPLFVDAINSLHQENFGKEARKGFAESFLKAGVGLPAGAGASEYRKAFSPLMRERISLQEEIVKIEKAIADFEKAHRVSQTVREEIDGILGNETLERGDKQRQIKELVKRKRIEASHETYASLLHTQRDLGLQTRAIEDSLKNFFAPLSQASIVAQGRESLGYLSKLQDFEKLVSQARTATTRRGGALSYDDIMAKLAAPEYRELLDLLGSEGKEMRDYINVLRRQELPDEASDRSRVKSTIRDKFATQLHHEEGLEDDVLERLNRISQDLEATRSGISEALVNQEDELLRKAYPGDFGIEYTPLEGKTNYEAINDMAGKRIFDAKTGRDMLAVGRAGDRLAALDLSNTTPQPLAISRGLERLDPKSVKSLADANLKKLMKLETGDARQAISELRNILSSPEAFNSAFRTVARDLAQANPRMSPEVLQDKAILSLFEGLGSRMGMEGSMAQTLLAKAAQVSESEAAGLRYGQELYMVLQEGIAQARVGGRRGARTGARLLEQVIGRVKYDKGTGFNVLMSNKPILDRGLASFNALLELKPSLQAEIMGTVSGIRRELGDEGSARIVQQYLANVFQREDLNLHRAILNKGTGLEMAQEIVSILNGANRRTASIYDSIPGTEGLTLADRLAAPERGTGNWELDDLVQQIRRTEGAQVQAENDFLAAKDRWKNLPKGRKHAAARKAARAEMDRLGQRSITIDVDIQDMIQEVKRLLGDLGPSFRERDIAARLESLVKDLNIAKERYRSPETPSEMKATYRQAIERIRTEMKQLRENLRRLKNPMGIIQEMEDRHSRFLAQELVSTVLGPASNLSPQQAEALAETLAKDPKAIEALRSGGVQILDKTASVFERMPKGESVQSYEFLHSITRNDKYLRNSPVGAFIMESTLRAAKTIAQGDDQTRILTFDLETAFGSTGRRLSFKTNPDGTPAFMRPAITEFGWMDLGASEAMQHYKSKTMSSLMANRGKNVFVLPGQETMNALNQLLGKSELSQMETEELRFLRGRVGVMQTDKGMLGGVLLFSPKNDDLMQQTGGMNVLVTQGQKDGKLKMQFVRHRSNGSSDLMVEAVDAREIAGFNIRKDKRSFRVTQNGKTLVNAEVWNEQAMAREAKRLLKTVSQPNYVVKGNNLLRHDIPVLLSMAYGIDLNDEAALAKAIQSHLPNLQLFDISAASRGLTGGAGTLEDVIRRYGIGATQSHNALEDVLHAAEAGMRLVDELTSRDVAYRVSVGNYLLDTRTGNLMRVDHIATNQGQLSQIFGTYADPLMGKGSIFQEAFEVERDLEELVGGKGLKQEARELRMKPLAFSLAERYEVISDLSKLNNDQQALIVKSQMERLRNPEYLRRAIGAAGSSEVPEMLQGLDRFLVGLREATQGKELTDTLLSGLIRAVAPEEQMSVYRLTGQPQKYTAYVNEELEHSLRRLARDEDAFKQMMGAVLESDRDRIHAGLFRANLSESESVYSQFSDEAARNAKKAFDERVRQAMLSADMGTHLSSMGLTSARTVPIKEMILPGDDVTPSRLMSAMSLGGDLPAPQNFLRDLTLPQRYEGERMLDWLQQDMRARMQDELARIAAQDAVEAEKLAQQYDGAMEHFTQAYRRVEGRIANQIRQYGNMAEIAASMRLRELDPDDPQALAQFIQRRASSSVRSQHLSEELAKITNDREQEAIKKVMRFYRQSGNMDRQMAEQLLRQLDPSFTSMLGIPSESNPQEIAKYLKQIERSYGIGVKKATGAVRYADAAVEGDALDYLRSLKKGALLRVSTSSVATPTFREEILSEARTLSRSEKAIGHQVLRRQIESVLGQGDATNRLLSGNLEDAIKSMSDDQMDQLYGLTHSGKAKLYDFNNTFLGYMDVSELPSLNKGQSYVARLAGEASHNQIPVEVGLARATGSAKVRDRVTKALDREAKRASAMMVAQHIENPKLKFTALGMGSAEEGSTVARRAFEQARETLRNEAPVETLGEVIMQEEGRQLLSERHRKLLIRAGLIAAGVGLYIGLSSPDIQGSEEDYLPQSDLTPPPETFYAHQLESFKDYKKERAKARMRAEKKNYDLQARGVQNYQIQIDAEAMGAGYDPDGAEAVIQDVLQRNVSRPLSYESNRDDQRRSINDAAYNSALRAYLDK